MEARKQTKMEFSSSDPVNPTQFKTVMKAIKSFAGMTFEYESESPDHQANVTKLGQHFEKITEMKETEAFMSDSPKQRPATARDKRI